MSTAPASRTVANWMSATPARAREDENANDSLTGRNSFQSRPASVSSIPTMIVSAIIPAVKRPVFDEMSATVVAASSWKSSSGT